MDEPAPQEIDKQTLRAIGQTERWLAMGRWRFILFKVMPFCAAYTLAISIVAAVVTHDSKKVIEALEGGIGTSVGGVIFGLFIWSRLPKELEDLRSGRLRAPNRDAREAWTLGSLGIIPCSLGATMLIGVIPGIAPPVAAMLMIAGIVGTGWGAGKYTRVVLRMAPARRDKITNGYFAAAFWFVLAMELFLCSVAYVHVGVLEELRNGTFNISRP
jgi:hypothetical protein